LAHRLQNTRGGQNLLALGLDEDILAASLLDRFDIAARLDPKTFSIKQETD